MAVWLLCLTFVSFPCVCVRREGLEGSNDRPGKSTNRIPTATSLLCSSDQPHELFSARAVREVLDGLYEMFFVAFWPSSIRAKGSKIFAMRRTSREQFPEEKLFFLIHTQTSRASALSVAVRGDQVDDAVEHVPSELLELRVQLVVEHILLLRRRERGRCTCWGSRDASCATSNVTQDTPEATPCRAQRARRRRTFAAKLSIIVAMTGWPRCVVGDTKSISVRAWRLCDHLRPRPIRRPSSRSPNGSGAHRNSCTQKLRPCGLRCFVYAACVFVRAVTYAADVHVDARSGQQELSDILHAVVRLTYVQVELS